MSVNGKFSDIGRADLLAVADRFAIPGAKRALGELSDALDSWPEFATLAELDRTVIDEVAREFARF
jgi:serine/threonine-protein kinase HipA